MPKGFLQGLLSLWSNPGELAEDHYDLPVKHRIFESLSKTNVYYPISTKSNPAYEDRNAFIIYESHC
jgi:hypothetical protein